MLPPSRVNAVCDRKPFGDGDLSLTEVTAVGGAFGSTMEDELRTASCNENLGLTSGVRWPVPARHNTITVSALQDHVAAPASHGFQWSILLTAQLFLPGFRAA